MATTRQMPDAFYGKKLQIRRDFHNREQREEESISEFYKELMSLASLHGNIHDGAIRSAFINGLREEWVAIELEDMKGGDIDTFYKKAIELEAEPRRRREMSQGIPATPEPSQEQQEASQEQALQHADAPTATGTSTPSYDFGKDLIVLPIAVPEDIKYYMNRQRRGLCLIFNFEVFRGEAPPTEREGSDKDVARIKEVFGGRGYEVPEIESNLTAAEVVKILKKETEDENREVDGVVCFLLSHGRRGEIRAHDQHILLQEMVETLMSVKALHGKPKIFFVQACQVTAKDEKNAETPVEWSCDIPSHPDLFFGFATSPGFVSYRSTTEGSIYIQTLCNTLKNSITSEDSSPDLETLMMGMARHISRKFETYNTKETEYHEKKQAPCNFSTLTNKVFL